MYAWTQSYFISALFFVFYYSQACKSSYDAVVIFIFNVSSIQVTVPARQNNVLLQSLLSDTEYKIMVTPIYADGEGVSLSAPGKTCEFKVLKAQIKATARI